MIILNFYSCEIIQEIPKNQYMTTDLKYIWIFNLTSFQMEL